MHRSELLMDDTSCTDRECQGPSRTRSLGMAEGPRRVRRGEGGAQGVARSFSLFTSGARAPDIKASVTHSPARSVC